MTNLEAPKDQFPRTRVVSRPLAGVALLWACLPVQYLPIEIFAQFFLENSPGPPGSLGTDAGVAAGLGVSMILIRSVNSLLYGIGNFDAPSFLGAGALLVAVGLLACMMPARRAMRVDPIIALRYE